VRLAHHAAQVPHRADAVRIPSGLEPGNEKHMIEARTTTVNPPLSGSAPKWIRL
jgi:hypothetical protein